MDMYWAHVLQSQLKKNNEKSSDNKISPDDKKSNNIKSYCCGNCGQNPYLCQCPSIITHPLKDNFDFEKSDY